MASVPEGQHGASEGKDSALMAEIKKESITVAGTHTVQGHSHPAGTYDQFKAKGKKTGRPYVASAGRR